MKTASAAKPAPSEIEVLPGPDDSFMSDVLEGLSKPQKAIPSKYLYDARGSELFERITETEEYYPTRVETALLREIAGEVSDLVGPHAQIIEPGSGAGEKIRILLAALEEPARLVPIDISAEILARSADEIADAFPDIDVFPIAGDFTALEDLNLPALEGAARRICFFPGSTIGNFEPAEIKALMRRIAHLVGSDGGLLIGVDLVKDIKVLEAAYNDKAGVTANFTKNLMARMNRELAADFDTSRFVHFARYHEKDSRIEIFLKSLAHQDVHVGGQEFHFAEGELLRTEYSHKFTLAGFRELGSATGWRPVKSWTDEKKLFSLHYFEAV